MNTPASYIEESQSSICLCLSKLHCIIQSDGVLRPRIIKWPDGRHFIIDKVICRRQAAAAKAGGQGDRYTIAVCGQERYLFFERSSNISGNTIGKWYVEVEVPVQ